MVVVDASSALDWFQLDSAHEESHEAYLCVSEHGAHVPGNFFAEVIQGLLRAERRNVSNEVSSALVVAELESLEIDVIDSHPQRVLEVARTHNISAYDAAYLTLALDQGVPLITSDRSLRTAALAHGLLWTPPKKKREK